MKRLKILLFSDIGWGKRKSELIVNEFKEIIENIGPDLIIFSGNFITGRYNFGKSSYLQYFIEILNLIEQSKINCLLMPGYYDRKYNLASEVVSLMKELKKFKMIEDISNRKVRKFNMVFYGVPQIRLNKRYLKLYHSKLKEVDFLVTEFSEDKYWTLFIDWPFKIMFIGGYVGNVISVLDKISVSANYSPFSFAIVEMPIANKASAQEYDISIYGDYTAPLCEQIECHIINRSIVSRTDNDKWREKHAQNISNRLEALFMAHNCLLLNEEDKMEKLYACFNLVPISWIREYAGFSDQIRTEYQKYRAEHKKLK